MMDGIKEKPVPMARSSYEGTNEEVMAMRDAELAKVHTQTATEADEPAQRLSHKELERQYSDLFSKLQVQVEMVEALRSENKILKLKKGPDDAVLIKLLRDDSDKKAWRISELMSQLEQLREVERIGRRDHAHSREAMTAVLERERESASVELCELKREVRRLRKLELELEARPPAAGGPRSAAAVKKEWHAQQQVNDHEVCARDYAATLAAGKNVHEHGGEG